MIEFLQGELVERNPSYVVLNCNGVGYFVNISLHTYGKLSPSGSCKVFTHQQIKEDAHSLFGFAEKEERQVFRQLISVSGVGASTAQMMLSSLGPEQVRFAIVHEDADTLKAVKGIGAKTAQRVIVDLKDKMGREESSSEISPIAYNTARGEALSALVALGFEQRTVNKVLDKLVGQNAEMTVEELVKTALKSF